MEPVAAYRQLLEASLTSSPNQLLLTIIHRGRTTLVTMCMLAKAFSVMIKALDLDPGLYSLNTALFESIVHGWASLDAPLN